MRIVVYNIDYCSEKDKETIKNDERIFSSMVRIAFNRLNDGNTEKYTYGYIRSLFENVPSYFAQCAEHQAKYLYDGFISLKEKLKSENKRIPSKYHFGSYKNMKERSLGKITNEEYKNKRNMGFWSNGQSNQKGNRLFEIDSENKMILYKRNRHEHIWLKIKENLTDKRFSILKCIEHSMKTCSAPIGFRIKNNKIHISYDENIVEPFKIIKNLKNNRVLGLDLNPNYIGLSILEFDKSDNFKILFKQLFDLRNIHKNKLKQTKINFELSQICSDIITKVKHFKVKTIAIERLEFNKTDRGYGSSFNKLINTKWRRRIFIDILKHMAYRHGIKILEIASQYSSIVGNILYGNSSTPDMIAASIEIARRSIHQFSKEWFYPKFDEQKIRRVLGTQWKHEQVCQSNLWKESFNKIKNAKIMYRVQLSKCKAVFRKKYTKRFIEIQIFSC